MPATTTRVPRPTTCLVLPAFPALGLLLAAASAPPPPRSPAEQYAAACASCHGHDGRGVERAVVGFELPLPDFTDCSFATREPDSDWGAVIRGGGPARGFDPLMPAFGDVLDDAAVAAVLSHVRTFCDSALWPRGELNFPRAMLTEKAFPEDEAVLTSTLPADLPMGLSNKLIYETRVAPMGQVEAIIPFSLDDLEGDAWKAGLGDVALGTKWVLFHSLDTGSIVSLAGEVKLPTGRPDLGYGKGVTILEPFVSAGQALPLDGFVQFMGGGEVSTDTALAPHELFGRGVLGMTFTEGRDGRAWSPMLEVAAAREWEEDAPVHWDLVPQLQITINQRQHLMAAAGVRIPVDRLGSEPPQLMTYLLWDWFDGGLTDGW
jgi:hypothetical protein